MNEPEILDLFRKSGALLEGHFILTSGAHSPQYFQCAKVLQYPNYAQLLCGELARRFTGTKIHVVVAPAVGGIIVGHEMARSLNARCVFAEREGGHMTLRRGFEIRRDENVLVVEDVVTTGGSVREVIDLVRAADANVIGVGYLVDRSGGRVDFGFPKATLLQMDVVKYDPGSCPLCRDGKLPAVKPGSRNLSLNIP